MGVAMSRTLLALGLLASTVIAAPAFASVDIAGTFTVAAHSSDPGLVIDITNNNGVVVPNLGNTPQTFNLFTISTDEGSVNYGEDTVHYPITVDFTFSAPNPTTGGAPVSGQTYGQYFGFLNIGQEGVLQWTGGPQTFNFGNGGQFEVALSNAVFNKGLFGLGKVGANVTGTFTLLHDSAVPEPAAWAMMIAGFGLTGAAMRRRRRVAVTYA